MVSLQKILQLCERHAFVTPVFAGDVVDYFKLGPAGELLRHNILNEWLLSSVITPEGNVFMCRSAASTSSQSTHSCFSEEGFKEQYSYVKNLCSSQLPFGLAETRQRHFQDGVPCTHQGAEYFEPSCGVELRLCMFTAHSDSAQCFHHWQRLRKMWWRKFSASPGRFSLTDMRSSEAGNTVQIQACFPWGAHTLESIKLHTNFADDASRAVFEARDGRKKVVPHVVECVTVVERALFTFLCDAYDEVELLGGQREAMRFHCKLAPYKVAVATTPGSDGDELGRLASYLTRQLRQAGTCVLHLPDVASKSLETQFVRNDVLGVPYTAVLNTATLKTGILGLRSRDTTLKEQVHISELKNHMEMILKNY